ncbi:MAG: S-methyl-5-thioribose-1-phosphate isomerase [Deltaproteobacteria bacterium]|nr:S-methyl-5-thioribose-1-phosphate isomerase [Deltaproteobacteria bacterium]
MSTSKTQAPQLNDVLSPVLWLDGTVALLDQRKLPGREVWLTYNDAQGVATAIRDMVVRGAPAIGCTAAMGLAAGAQSMPEDAQAFIKQFDAACDILAASRPTAVNLFWAIDQQREVVAQMRNQPTASLKSALVDNALRIWREDIAACQAIGRFGAELLPKAPRVLTHCNAGALATGGYGTALGVIRGAVEAGKPTCVYADETRPYLQGARLTAWELMRDNIDVTLICDNMAAALLAKGEINCIVVGSDRIAGNGDVANKIGTYGLAVLAKHHNVPFYVAAPLSTIDRQVTRGEDIPIEERPAEEVTRIGGYEIAPRDVKVRYPAFDVTPANLVTAIITEVGVAQPPQKETIDKLFER